MNTDMLYEGLFFQRKSVFASFSIRCNHFQSVRFRQFCVLIRLLLFHLTQAPNYQLNRQTGDMRME